ncbi:hypothetical protein Tco_1028813 [Tanacetum coccineum]|uniref:Uncharacterized protein n=1 Tax=Tanacetum coccineum TaxID=301880 RepID=A0ABQ5G1P8_9ASTR
MPYLRFTKVIINHLLSLHKTIPKGLPSSLNTIKDDGNLSRMKFFRIGEDVQEYGKATPDTMLTNAIKQLEAYKEFIDYSTGLVPPKKTRGKGSKGKQQEVTTKNKTIITIDNNIIVDAPDVAFELGKSISKTDVEIADETRRVYETHAHLVTEKTASEEASKESGGELAHRVIGRRRTRGVTIRDTPTISNKSPPAKPQKLKGIQVITDKEQFAVDIKKAMKSSREATRTGFEEESDKSNKNVDDISWVSTSGEEEKGDDDDDDDDMSIDIEETDDERTDSDNGDQAMTDAEKNVDEKKKLEQGDEKQAEEDQDYDDQDQKYQTDDDIIGTLITMSQKEKLELPRSSSSRSLSSNYGNQFLNLSSDASLIVSVIPPQTTTTSTPLTTPLNTPLLTPPIISTTTTTTPTISNPLPVVVHRVSDLKKEVKEHKPVDHSITILAAVRSQVPSVIDEYLGSTIGDTLQKVLQKHTKELIQQFPQKSVSEIIKSYERHPTYKALYDARLDSIFLDENDMDRLTKDPFLKGKDDMTTKMKTLLLD